MESYIRKLSEEFLQEAISAPRLFRDMAQMEKYMAESYNERALTELIQNADDAESSTFYIDFLNGDLIVANNGKPFNKQDVETICRSGSSKKRRGQTIGYRGVGFKSTTCFSSHIIIISKDCAFSFSKEYAARALNASYDEVPSIRIPLWVCVDDLSYDLKLKIDSLRMNGFNTIFVFKNANASMCIQETERIDFCSLIFLRHIHSIIIEKTLRNIRLERTISTANGNHSVIIKDLISQEEKEYNLISNNESYAIAVPNSYDEDNGFNSNEDEVFHCYLPTLDRTGFKFRINGDFSTDPSRKHIIDDQRTRIECERIGQFLACYVIEQYHNKNSNEQLLRSIYEFVPLNKFGALIYETLQRTLEEKNWLYSIEDTSVLLANALLLPCWFRYEWRGYLEEAMPPKKGNSYVIIRNESLYNMVLRFGARAVKDTDLTIPLKNRQIVKKMSTGDYITWLSHIVPALRLKEKDEFFRISDLYFPNSGTVIQLKQALSNNSIVTQFKGKIKAYHDNSAVEWFLSQFGLSQGQESPTKSILKKRKRIIPHWQTAEQLCVELEKERGYQATDVSLKNLGYDVISESMGRKRYIEVKSVFHIGDPITLTNNEYSTAHQYGDQYYLCIISQEVPPKALYVQDPLNYGALEKRVRMWEWVYTDYKDNSSEILLVE